MFNKSISTFLCATIFWLPRRNFQIAKNEKLLGESLWSKNEFWTIGMCWFDLFVWCTVCNSAIKLCNSRASVDFGFCGWSFAGLSLSVGTETSGYFFCVFDIRSNGAKRSIWAFCVPSVYLSVCRCRLGETHPNFLEQMCAVVGN